MLSITFPCSVGPSLTLAVCFWYFEGADELVFFEDVQIIKPGSHVSSFPGSKVIFPGPSENSIDCQGDARGICSNLSCLGEGGDIRKLTNWQITM